MGEDRIELAQVQTELSKFGESQLQNARIIVLN
jgi:hypothetical protein